MKKNNVRTIFAKVSTFGIVIAIFLFVGWSIGMRIANMQRGASSQYNKTLRINDDSEMFQRAINTDAGKAFIYGELHAVDPIEKDDVPGTYISLVKVKEEYRRHVRTVPHTKVKNGKPEKYYTTESYWKWDEVASERDVATKVTFCDVEFKYDEILNLKREDHKYIKETIESSTVRYKYYGYEADTNGTLYATLSNGSIYNCRYFVNKGIQEVIDDLKSKSSLAVFIFVCSIVAFAILVGISEIEWRGFG